MVIVALLLMAQEPELVRGTLEKPAVDQIAVRTAEGRVAACKVDESTHREAPAGPWQTGDMVEGWFYAKDSGCRWLSLKLVQRRAGVDRPKVRLNLNPLDSIVQRGNLMFAGIIVEVDGKRLTVRARNGTRYILVLRPDTHVLSDGLEMNVGQLPLNQTVYVRAGANFEGDIEVFRIAWGQIVQPR